MNNLIVEEIKNLKCTGMTAKQIAKKLNISISSVYKSIHNYSKQIVKDRICKGCSKEFRGTNSFCNKNCWISRRNKAYGNLKVDYFKHIDSDEKAYWLGFLFADGHVYEKPGRSKWLDFVLSIKDEDRIDLFIAAIGLNPKFKYFRKNGNSDQVGVRLGHQEFVNNLIAQKCIPRKKKVLEYPSIDERFDLPFILGYIDGDGCYFVKGYRRSLTITSGSRNFLETIKRKLGIPGAITVDLRENICYTLYINTWAHDKIFESYQFSMPRKRPK